MSPLMNAALAVMEPIVENRPERLVEMAEALEHFAGVAANTGRHATADRYHARALLLRHRAECEANR